MTHMYERGQLVVPKYFREILGWGKDTAVSFRVEDNRLIVERRTSIADELEEFARECNVDLKGKTDFDDDCDKAMKRKYAKMGLRF